MSSRVIAFVEDSPAATPVVATASVLGHVLSATVEAVQVGKRPGPAATAVTASAQVPLRVVPGEAAARIIAEMRPNEVVAGVLGARRHPIGPRPAGHTALEVITGVDKLIAVVPPEAEIRRPRDPTRILVPLDGTEIASRAVQKLCETCARSGVEILILHVFDEDTTPRFWDQPHYESEAFAEAFLARHLTDSEAGIRLRTGTPQHNVLQVASKEHVDLIALGWSQSLDPGRAAVVRRALSEAPVPVLLVPAG